MTIEITSGLTLLDSPPFRLFVVSIEQAIYYVFAVKTEVSIILHWGVAIENSQEWLTPTPEILPPFQPTTTGATFAETHFVDSKELFKKEGISDWFELLCDTENLSLESWKFVIGRLPALRPRVGSIRAINFVLHSLSDDRWYKDPSGKDFHIDLTALESQQSEQMLLNKWEATVGKISRPAASLQWKVSSGTRTFTLKASIHTLKDRLELMIIATHPNLLVLHWGGCSTTEKTWHRVSTSGLIEDTLDSKSFVIDDKALQTPFAFVDPHVSIQTCNVHIKAGHIPELIAFVLKEHGSQVWLNNKNADFLIQIPQMPEWTQAKQEAIKQKQQREEEIKLQREKDKNIWTERLVKFNNERAQRDISTNLGFSTWKLSDDMGVIDCAAYGEGEQTSTPSIVLEINACLRVQCHLHWGCVGVGGELQRRKHGEWICPPANLHPPNTISIDARAAQTKLHKLSDDEKDKFLYFLIIRFPAHPKAVASAGDIGLRAEFGGVAFVLKESDGNRWFKAADGRDILCRLYATDTPVWKGSHTDLVACIIEAEVEWDHMTLMHRYNLCSGIIDRHLADSSSKSPDSEHEFWSWIFVWNRFSFLCWLDWQRRYNTKPKDLAHAAEVLSCKVAKCWRDLPGFRVWTRMTLATMGRGGSSGQAIRDRILDIMHKHKLPETSGNFYEQWHQKLHNNTTPDDIGICLAVIRFLETGGDLGAYWWVLKEHGINAAKLASYERSIRMEPYMPHCDVGSLIWDLRMYLDILKEVHDALDLERSAHRVRHLLRHDLQDKLNRILSEAKHHKPSDFNQVLDRMGQIYDVRCDIINRLNGGEGNEATIRDLLLLDFSLEAMSSALLQGANKSHGSGEQWMMMLYWLIELWSLHNPCEEEWKALKEDWAALGMNAIRTQFTHDGRCDALMAKALLDRLTRAVGDTTDSFQQRLGASSAYLGLQVDTDPAKLNVFVDEVLRGSSLFAVSVGVKHLEPLLRKAAELPPWQLISLAPLTRGMLVSVATLSNIQDKIFEIPTILISDAVNGEEEIPTGVQGVLVRSAAAAPDILSHISVRARNAHVLLAVCFNPDIVEHWEKAYQNKWVEIEVVLGGSDLNICPCQGNEMKLSRRLSHSFDRQLTQSKLSEISASFHHSSSLKSSMLFDLRKPSEEYFITLKHFRRSDVGSKSMNLMNLKAKLSHMLTPRAFAMPYGSLNKTLCAVENQNIHIMLEKVLDELSPTSQNSATSDIFVETHKLIDQLIMPGDLQSALCEMWSEIESTNSHLNTGIVSGQMKQLWDESSDEKCWQAIKAVWASMFAMRPWVSLAKANRSFMNLNMAILIQELMPADYAFVLHSRNPFEESKNGQREMYGEIVQGLGEVLVANYPGRALSFKMVEHEDPKIVAFPAKSHSLLAQRTLIFRSDSNGEDLEGFAGAGLFESVPAIIPHKHTVVYKDLKLINDHQWRQNLLKSIGQAAFEVEDAFGNAMDIEGVVCKDQIVIVQARPQV